jgi:hypothetical protein
MKNIIHILHLEDDPVEAELIYATLANEGLQVEPLRVETGKEFEQALQAGGIDLILADFKLPTFDGLSAQKIAVERAPDVPFIFVTGTIGEERAVEVLKQGANDYVLKDRLSKLGTAVRRAIKEVEDRTERKRIEKELHESERNFRLLAEHSTDMILRYAPNEVILYSSPACQALLGYKPEELAGMDPFQIIHPDDGADFRQAYQGLLRNPAQQSATVTHRMRHRGGEYKWFETTARAARDMGADVEIHCSSRDITERKNLERQLLQSQKIEGIGRLAGGIAHDFNNLLTVILGRTELIMAQLAPESALRPKLDLVHSTARRAADLTRQLLTFSRQQILEPQVVELNGIVTSMNEMLRRLIGEDISLTTSLAHNLKFVKADPSQLEQVIVNLVVNARDAMPRGGKLIIETANAELDDEYAHKHLGVKPGHYVMLSVTDTGTGMTAEVKSHIFEPFFTTKEVGKGTGLGLSTVYGIVKQSGGYVYVYSEFGYGTTLKIYLPSTSEKPHSPANSSQSQKAVASETIMVVEDEDAVRQLIEDVLSEHGYRVISAASGTDAVQACQKQKGKIDLLLTDIVMEGMIGTEVVARVKTFMPDLKVLYTSGYADKAVGNRSVLQAGVDFIQKPFTQAALIGKIREVLDREKT